jgi:hypothetical protein
MSAWSFQLIFDCVILAFMFTVVFCCKWER